ncbi:hypothetical protein BU16DRAFT_144424 [Lophium mytilinum]|uniref:Uncharacterized protein n=1 Tax=Lophium mytilinum TaxID=390894 RepID=A0A6A6QI48_9PEZI|nr:hypothetical protein BU16DRAFT_144424 [Lophium mytilinum]
MNLTKKPNLGMLDFSYLWQNSVDGLKTLWTRKPTFEVEDRSSQTTSATTSSADEPMQDVSIAGNDIEEGPSTPPDVDWVFAGETEDDYTAGPAKMVEASDGTKACAAVALSFDLSKKIQDSLMGRRMLQQLSFEIEQQRDEIAAEEQKLTIFILRQDRKVETIEIEVEEAGGEPTAQQQDKMQEHRAAIRETEKQRAMLKENDELLVQRWEGARQQQEMLQNEVNVILEDVFVTCNLLPPVMYNEPSLEQHEGFYDEEEQPSFDDANVFEAPTLGNTTVAGQNVLRVGDNAQNAAIQAGTNLEHSRGDLLRAQRNFDAYQCGYNQDLQAYLSSQVNRPYDDVKLEHDLLHLQKGRRLTGELIQAEKRFEDAEIEAKAAGVFPGYYQESNFADCPDDGYREGQELEIAARVDRKRIEEWLENAEGDGMSPPPEPEMDQWSVDSDKPFDSISVLAEGPNRKQIDRWRQETGHC